MLERRLACGTILAVDLIGQDWKTPKTGNVKWSRALLDANGNAHGSSMSQLSLRRFESSTFTLSMKPFRATESGKRQRCFPTSEAVWTANIVRKTIVFLQLGVHALWIGCWWRYVWLQAMNSGGKTTSSVCHILLVEAIVDICIFTWLSSSSSLQQWSERDTGMSTSK